ncbi:3D domain-containing protein [Bacillus mojavensis]
MKKFKNKTVALASALCVTTTISICGWANLYSKNKELEDALVDEKDKTEQKSTEIAKLDDVIVKKDDELKANKKVIEKQKSQLKLKNEEIEKLKKKLKQKPKEKVIYKEKKNFDKKEKGSDVVGESDSNSKSIGNFEMTSYVAMCSEGCTGITRTGVDVRNTTTYQGHKIIATDPSVIPLWSIVKINTKSGSFTAISLDTGGGINGNEIDFLVGSETEARNNGRQIVSVEMIRKGK